MTANKRLIDRLRLVKEQSAAEPKAGVLPLVAFYGRDPASEETRAKMYDMMSRAMAADVIIAPPLAQQNNYLYLDMQDAITILNAKASPIEFLVSNGEMELGEDEDGMGGVRFHTAIRFRDLVNGAQIKGLKSANLDGVGGGGSAPIDIMAYQVDCRKILRRLREIVREEWVYRMLEAVVVMDEWLDLWPEGRSSDKRGVKRKQRMKTIIALHYGLDIAAKALGYMNKEAFIQRWHQGVPVMPQSVRHHMRDPRVANQLALLT